MLNKILKILNNKYAKYIFILITFLLIFGDINRSPYKADDFVYMNIYGTGVPITSIKDIFVSQYQHWLTWGGRNVVHFILQFLLFIGKPWSSLLCAGVYVALISLIAKGCNANTKLTSLRFCLIAGLLYYVNPLWDETVVWFTGNANYIWGPFLVLLSIYIDSISRKRNHWWINIVDLVILFFAAWTNENTGFIVVLYQLYKLYVQHKSSKKWDSFRIVKILLAIAGFALMVLAPGNSVRSSVITSELGTLQLLLLRIYGINHAIFQVMFLLIVITVFFILVVRKKGEHQDAILFFVFALISVFVMIATPTYPDRATLGTIYLFLTSICCSFANDFEDPKVELVSYLPFLGFFMSLAPSLILTLLHLR